MSYKIIPPNHVVDLTLTLEEGLLLSANPLCKLIVESALARAQYHHPVTVSHYITEASHVHMLAVARDPKDIAGFQERFKTETAHYLNRMLGRKKRTVWCKGYAALPILTVSSAMKKIRYIYTNPAKDNLEETIDNFPGLSRWSAWSTGRCKKTLPRLHRPMMPHLPGKFYAKNTYKRLKKELKQRAKQQHVFTLEPDAWMEVFQITDEAERRAINENILLMIREEERELKLARDRAGKTVIGREALAAAHLDLDYVPDRKGTKMWCICDDKDLRVRYIEWAKEIKRQAREVYERWKTGDFSVPFPPGVFAPAMPKLANMSPLATCF